MSSSSSSPFATLWSSLHSPLLNRNLHFDKEVLVDHLSVLFTYLLVLVIAPYWLLKRIGDRDGRYGREGNARHFAAMASGVAPRVALLDEAARWPEPDVRSHAIHGAPVYALWACADVKVPPNCSVLVPTGVRVWAPPGWMVVCFTNASKELGSGYAAYAPPARAKGGIGLRVSNDSNASPLHVKRGASVPIGYVTFVPAHTLAATRCVPDGREMRLVERRARMQRLLLWPFVAARALARCLAKTFVRLFVCSRPYTRDMCANCSARASVYSSL